MASRDIKDLHLDFQSMVRELLRKGSEQVTPYIFFITDGFRTASDQDALYAKGRDGNKGRIVTNARAGQSPHEYGLAVDLAFQKDGILYYDDWLYQRIYPIARELGFSLGVDWKNPDRPHFEYPNWKIKVKEQMPATTLPQVEMIEAHRNITVTDSIGLNVREQPSTSSRVISKLIKGSIVQVVGWVEGENVAGNNKWWVLATGSFMWSGATNVVPTVIESLPQQEITNDLPEMPENESQLVTTLRNELKARDQTIAEQISEISDLNSKMTTLKEQASNNETFKTANQGLSSTLEKKEAEIKQYQKKLQVAYAVAFSGWELIELPQGASFFNLQVPTLLKVWKLLLDLGKNKYVIGWKKDAQLYQTEINNQGAEISDEAIDRAVG